MHVTPSLWTHSHGLALDDQACEHTQIKPLCLLDAHGHALLGSFTFTCHSHGASSRDILFLIFSSPTTSISPSPFPTTVSWPSQPPTWTTTSPQPSSSSSPPATVYLYSPSPSRPSSSLHCVSPSHAPLGDVHADLIGSHTSYSPPSLPSSFDSSLTITYPVLS